MSIAIGPGIESGTSASSCSAVKPNVFPARPVRLQDLGSIKQAALNMAVKMAFTVPNFTTHWMASRLKLPTGMTEQLLWELKEDKLIEILGEVGPLNYKFATSEHGRESARRLQEICGYLGPVPVSLEEYNASIEAQYAANPSPTMDEVYAATQDIILPAEQKQVAALAASSGRSLFVFGPPGNGKSTLAQMLHNVNTGDCWIPYAIAIEDQVIQLFDPQVHKPIENSADDEVQSFDTRWIKIARPLVITGGEMTLDQMDLAYDHSNRFYEAPPHMKANCGTYIFDDFGRQRAEPSEMLNRWIIPLERNIDFLSLNTGKKIKVPFRMMLIVATNLEIKDVADNAFLRRMGYRLHLNSPNEKLFREIISAVARKYRITVEPSTVDYLIDRYRTEDRRWNASEPGELFARCQDICRLRGEEFAIDRENISLAWTGFFSNGCLLN